MTFVRHYIWVVALLMPESLAACGLECANKGVCTRMEGDEYAYHKKIQSGQLVEACTCPRGFAGLACDIPRLECVQQSDGTHQCSNGISCTVEGNDFSCSACSLAESVSKFAGFMCRKPATEYCSPYDSNLTLSYCTNGGKCKKGFVRESTLSNSTDHDLQLGCRCPPEFDGPHCEFLVFPSGFWAGSDVSQPTGISAKGAVAVGATVVFGSAIVVMFLFLRYRKRQRGHSIFNGTNDFIIPNGNVNPDESNGFMDDVGGHARMV